MVEVETCSSFESPVAEVISHMHDYGTFIPTKQGDKKLADPCGAMGDPLDFREIEGLLGQARYHAEEVEDEEEEEKGFKKYVKLVLPHVALVLVVCMYACAGAAVFYSIESPNEHMMKEEGISEIKRLRSSMVEAMWNHSRQGHQPLLQHLWLNTSDHHLTQFTTALYRNFKDNFVSYKDVRYKENTGDEDYDDDFGSRRSSESGSAWTPASAIFFAATTMATIGYGNIVPVTARGRVICVFFALFGAPLAIITIGDLGKFLSECTIWLYKRIKLCRKTVRTKMRRWRGDKRRSLSEGDDASDASEEENEQDMEWEELILDKTQVPVAMVFAILLLYIAFGALLFSFMEGWTYVDSFYFCFITLTTVGFGDLVPKKHQYIVLMLLYIGLGLAVTTMCIDLVGITYIQKIHYFGRKFKGTDLLQLLKRRKMMEVLAQRGDLMQLYFERAQQQESLSGSLHAVSPLPWKETEWDAEPVDNMFVYEPPKIQSPSIPSTYSTAPSIQQRELYFASLMSPRSLTNSGPEMDPSLTLTTPSSVIERELMFFRNCNVSRDNSWKESGPDLSLNCSLATTPSQTERDYLYNVAYARSPSARSFKHEFPYWPTEWLSAIAQAASRRRKLSSCPDQISLAVTSVSTPSVDTIVTCRKSSLHQHPIHQTNVIVNPLDAHLSRPLNLPKKLKTETVKQFGDRLSPLYLPVHALAQSRSSGSSPVSAIVRTPLSPTASMSVPCTPPSSSSALPVLVEIDETHFAIVPNRTKATTLIAPVETVMQLIPESDDILVGKMEQKIATSSRIERRGSWKQVELKPMDFRILIEPANARRASLEGEYLGVKKLAKAVDSLEQLEEYESNETSVSEVVENNVHSTHLVQSHNSKSIVHGVHSVPCASVVLETSPVAPLPVQVVSSSLDHQKQEASMNMYVETVAILAEPEASLAIGEDTGSGMSSSSKHIASLVPVASVEETMTIRNSLATGEDTGSEMSSSSKHIASLVPVASVEETMTIRNSLATGEDTGSEMSSSSKHIASLVPVASVEETMVKEQYQGYIITRQGSIQVSGNEPEGDESTHMPRADRLCRDRSHSFNTFGRSDPSSVFTIASALAASEPSSPASSDKSDMMFVIDDDIAPNMFDIIESDLNSLGLESALQASSRRPSKYSPRDTLPTLPESPEPFEPTVSPVPEGLICMETWVSFKEMEEESKKTKLRPPAVTIDEPSLKDDDDLEPPSLLSPMDLDPDFPSSALTTPLTSPSESELDFGAFEVMSEAGVSAAEVVMREDALIYHESLPVHSVHHQTVRTEQAVANLMACPESVCSIEPPPVVVSDNYCFVVDGEKVKMDDIMGDDHWWRHTSRPTKYYYSDDLKRFFKVNIIQAKGKVLSARFPKSKLPNAPSMNLSASTASGLNSPRSRGTSGHEESDLPMHHIYKVIRFYSFWKTCPSFHRIVTLIGQADDDHANPGFKKRIFVQYLWRNAKETDKKQVAKEFNPHQQKLLQHVTDPSSKKKMSMLKT